MGFVLAFKSNRLTEKETRRGKILTVVINGLTSPVSEILKGSLGEKEVSGYM